MFELYIHEPGINIWIFIERREREKLKKRKGKEGKEKNFFKVYNHPVEILNFVYFQGDVCWCTQDQ